jgi:sugar lactone lactonase YvrE
MLLCLIPPALCSAQIGIIDFTEEYWDLSNAEVIEHLGRNVMAGSAYLKDVEFHNGTIEFDIAVSGKTSYPGVMFRMTSERDYERIYIRPHRASLYPDAVQYVPTFNGISGWQLYNGDGYTTGADIPTDDWVRIKLEVSGVQARVYVGGGAQPALAITSLKHGDITGFIGLSGPKDGTAYFSNFSYRLDDSLEFPPPPIVETPPGTFTTWQISQSFRLTQLDIEEYPLAQRIGDIEWETVESEPQGLVDLARYRQRSGREPDCVLARTPIYSDTDQTLKLKFGYSDAVSVFMNGQLVFFGNSAYRQRDPSFLGVVGLNDIVYLPLRQGENELLLVVTESFGGWGFVCRDGRAVYQHETVEKVFETDDIFLTPESVVYDPARNVLYVSNYDAYRRAFAMGGQFISKVSPDGEVLELVWAEGLRMPTGMAIRENSLFVVERDAVAEVNLDNGKIWTRNEIPDPVFPNDIAIDGSGRLYISDSGADVIYRFDGNEFEQWLSGDKIDDPNALYMHGEQLLIGNNGDNTVKSANIATGETTTVARFAPGIIDGIRALDDDDLIVSQWGGRLYRVSPAGEVEKLVDTSTAGINIADFEYLPEKKLVVTPSFAEDRIITYRLGN